MGFLSRIFVFLRLLSVLKDLKLYSDFISITKKESIDSPEWNKLKLRRDWFGRIYTVVNLPPEVTQSRDFPIEARPAWVFEEIRPVNEYLTRLNLQEIIAPLLRPLPEANGDSFLVIYYFVFREFSWMWIFRFLLEIFIFAYVYFNWSYLLGLLSANGLG
jgi:hypothetical protein